MIIKLAFLAIKRLPKVEKPSVEALEENNQVVHLSRPDKGKLKTPIRIIE